MESRLEVTVTEASVRREASVREVLSAIDRAATGAVAVVDIDGRFLGLISDGDVRRALIAGISLDSEAGGLATKAALTVGPDTPRSWALDLLSAHGISSVPIVDGDGRFRGMHTLRHLVTPAIRPNWCLVMAGGRGKRLGALTDERPKPLVTVAGRPISEWLLLQLVGCGMRNIVISVGYLGSQVEDFFGSGDRYGCRIEYVHDEPANPLGTIGPLALASEQVAGLASMDVLVVNGDLMTRVDVSLMLDAHTKRHADLTVATRRYSHQVPFGVVEASETGTVTALVEKPIIATQVSLGMYVVGVHAIELIPIGTPLDATQLIEMCLRNGLSVQSHLSEDDWLDVGTPIDLDRARGNIV